MNWRDFILGVYENRKLESDIQSRPAFQAPASTQEIQELESQLVTSIPESLRTILLETNGVMDTLNVNGEWFENMWLIWPTTEIISRNVRIRNDSARNGCQRSFQD